MQTTDYLGIVDVKVIKKNILSSGFSLIELLVVIGVIGVLGGIIFSAASYLFKENSSKTVAVHIEVIKLALNDYKRDNGEFPLTPLSDWDGREGAKILLHALIGTHEFDQSTNSWTWAKEGKFLKNYLPKDDLNYQFFDKNTEPGSLRDLLNVEHMLVDSWGEPIVYQYPRVDEHEGFLVYSKGPDRKSSPFLTASESTPERRPEDLDNIPTSEPGKW